MDEGRPAITSTSTRTPLSAGTCRRDHGGFFRAATEREATQIVRECAAATSHGGRGLEHRCRRVAGGGTDPLFGTRRGDHPLALHQGIEPGRPVIVHAEPAMPTRAAAGGTPSKPWGCGSRRALRPKSAFDFGRRPVFGTHRADHAEARLAVDVPPRRPGFRAEQRASDHHEQQHPSENDRYGPIRLRIVRRIVGARLLREGCARGSGAGVGCGRGGGDSEGATARAALMRFMAAPSVRLLRWCSCSKYAGYLTVISTALLQRPRS